MRARPQPPLRHCRKVPQLPQQPPSPQLMVLWSSWRVRPWGRWLRGHNNRVLGKMERLCLEGVAKAAKNGVPQSEELQAKVPTLREPLRWRFDCLFSYCCVFFLRLCSSPARTGMYVPVLGCLATEQGQKTRVRGFHARPARAPAHYQK
jgi:hypothetical protein